ncbi:MAG: gamma-glutamyl-gamma-aminobutyrate hydrolase family protein [Balneolaceae bacterium]|nr:gamma-glutamyl-gamma-aminobutyrate hydrolase family protein [Balneolaceae bacterium]MDR9409946.1 gamma-glutamyl-gamma-aminobutyrate hydrolase family protein [Balneolaceae bacterium]
MRAHVNQHVAFEGLGSMEEWLKENGYEITTTCFFESADLPKIDSMDLLIVLGGPMSVNDEEEYPWLVSEKEFIRDAIEADIPVLGICLGAQLIANTLGSKVYPNPEKEIGWFPVNAIQTGSTSTFQFPSSFECFHWHGETFDLPPGATLLAKSDVCENQAFQLGRSVIGLQFHLETTPKSAKNLIQNCRHELIPSIYIQTEKEMLSAPVERYHKINKMMAEILEYLHNQIH